MRSYCIDCASKLLQIYFRSIINFLIASLDAWFLRKENFFLNPNINQCYVLRESLYRNFRFSSCVSAYSPPTLYYILSHLFYHFNYTWYCCHDVYYFQYLFYVCRNFIAWRFVRVLSRSFGWGSSSHLRRYIVQARYEMKSEEKK